MTCLTHHVTCVFLIGGKSGSGEETTPPDFRTSAICGAEEIIPRIPLVKAGFISMPCKGTQEAEKKERERDGIEVRKIKINGEKQ